MNPELLGSMRTSGEIALDARLLLELYLKKEEGQIASWEEQSQVLGYDVRSSKGKHPRRKAHQIARIDHGILLRAVANVGDYVVPEKDRLGVIEARRTKVRTQGKLTAEEVCHTVEYERCDDIAKVKHNTLMTWAGMVQALTRKKNLAKLEEKVGAQGSMIPPMLALECFTSSRNPNNRKK